MTCNYTTGSSFGMNSFYNTPKIKYQSNTYGGGRNDGIICSTDNINTQITTSVVIEQINPNSFDKSISTNHSIRTVDFGLNENPNNQTPILNQYSMLEFFESPPSYTVPILTNGSKMYGPLYNGNAVFSLVNYSSLLSIFPQILSVISPNSVSQAYSFMLSGYNPTTFQMNVPQQYISPSSMSFTLSDNTTLTLSFSVKNMPCTFNGFSSPQTYCITVMCEPSFSFQIVDQNSSVPILYSTFQLRTTTPPRIVNHSIMYTSQTITLFTQGSGNYTYNWIGLDPVPVHLTISPFVKQTNNYIETNTVTLTIDSTITNFVTLLLCTVTDTNTGISVNIPITLAWGPLATSEINTEIRAVVSNSTTSPLLLKFEEIFAGSVSAIGVSTYVIINLWQTASIATAVLEYQTWIGSLQGGETVASLGLDGMTVGADGEILEAASTTEESIGILETAVEGLLLLL